MRKSGVKVEKPIVVTLGEYDSFDYSGAVPFKIFGGLAENWIRTGAGSDSIFGNDGDDFIDGGSGNNHLDGGADDDSLYSGSGNDILFGGSGDDFVYSGGGNDKLDGGTGNDWLVAFVEAGKTVTLLGKSGHDGFNLYAGTGGKAFADGGSGNDIFYTSASMVATLTGGTGNDTFAFSAYNGGQVNARITDLELGDVLNFASLGTWTWDDLGNGHFDALAPSEVTIQGDLWVLGGFGTVSGIDVLGVYAQFGFDYDVTGGGKG